MLKATLGLILALATVVLLASPWEEITMGSSPVIVAGTTVGGDTNCDGSVNAIDAALVLQQAAGILRSLPCPENGNVSDDDVTNVLDAALILQFAAGLLAHALPPVQCPAGQGTCPGDVDCDGDVDWDDYDTMPSTIGEIFLPPDECQDNADIDCDGSVDTNDAAHIQRFLQFEIATLPECSTAVLDISGVWDASYSLTCNAVFDQEATELSATVNCGAGAVGTLVGSVDAAAAVFSLSGQLGALAVSLEGFIVDDDSLGGTYSAPVMRLNETFEAVRVDPGSGTELDGEWIITLGGIFAGGCTIEIEQDGVDLTTMLDCASISPLSGPLSGVTLVGTLDGNEVMLMGPVVNFVGDMVLMDATVSEDGDSVEGIWQISPVEVIGSFTASRRTDSAGSLPPAESRR